MHVDTNSAKVTQIMYLGVSYLSACTRFRSENSWRSTKAFRILRCISSLWTRKKHCLHVDSKETLRRKHIYMRDDAWHSVSKIMHVWYGNNPTICSGLGLGLCEQCLGPGHRWLPLKFLWKFFRHNRIRLGESHRHQSLQTHHIPLS